MYIHSSNCNIILRCIRIFSRRSHITLFSPRLAKMGVFAAFIQGICGRQRGSSITYGHPHPTRTFDPSLRPICSSHSLFLRNTKRNSFISEARGISKKKHTAILAAPTTHREEYDCSHSLLQTAVRSLRFNDGFISKQNKTRHYIRKIGLHSSFFFIVLGVYTRYSSTETVTSLCPQTSVCANAQE